MFVRSVEGTPEHIKNFKDANWFPEIKSATPGQRARSGGGQDRPARVFDIRQKSLVTRLIAIVMPMIMPMVDPVVPIVVPMRVVIPVVSVVRAERHGIIWVLVIIRAIERSTAKIATEGGEEELRLCRGGDSGGSGARKHDCDDQLSHGCLHRLMARHPRAEWRAGPR